MRMGMWMIGRGGLCWDNCDGSGCLVSSPVKNTCCSIV